VRATNWVLAVNGAPTPTLDAFLDVVAPLGHERDVRLKCVDLGGKTRMYTLRTDTRYWPTVELRSGGGGGGGGGGRVAGEEAATAAASVGGTGGSGGGWELIRHG
jgi:hypothetical protein